jgi:Leucine-rich repeat (LRR) protein
MRGGGSMGYFSSNCVPTWIAQAFLQSIGGISIDISFPTAGPVVFPATINGYNPYPTPSTLTFGAVATGANLSTVASFVGMSSYGSAEVILDLSLNNITGIPSQSLGSLDGIASLNLSSNSLTFVAPDAINFSFSLVQLILSNNNLTIIPVDLQRNTPSLKGLFFDHNDIIAIPAVANHISSSSVSLSHLHFNPLTCEQYGPAATGCICKGKRNNIISNFGYVFCSENQPGNHGCPSETWFNASDTSTAPWPSCINQAGIPSGVYYDVRIEQFLPLTVCDQAFQKTNSTAFLRAYQ